MTSSPRPLRLLLVDDHEVVRQGLAALLARRPAFQVVAEAGTVAEALAAARRGDSLLDPAVTERVLERVRRTAAGEGHDELAELTSQERKILMLVAEGKTNREIAAEVFLSDKTVKNYVSSILSKLNLQRRAQAAAFVARHRLGGDGP